MGNKIMIYSFFIFFLFLISMELWIGWGSNKSIMLSLFGIGAVACKLIFRIPWTVSKRNVLLCIAFYGGYYLVHEGFGVIEFFTQIPPQLIPIICIVFLNDKYKEQVLNNITKWFAWLMTISILVYAITMVVPLPNFGVLTNGDRYGSFLNYIFYVKEYNNYDIGVLRFGGPFLEPGYLGMIGAFLLFVNQYDLKRKDVFIIFISTLLTLSLAGWALAFIGYLEIQYYKGNVKISKVIAFTCILLIFVLFGLFYNDGNNLINNEILSRLAFDKEKGFVGNNRNVETMMIYFHEMWGHADLLLLGYPESAFYGLSDWETIGAGLDRFVVFHGLLGVFYVFLFYLVSLLYVKNRKYAYLFFMLILICFWQRTYSLWFSWIICFHYSIITKDAKERNV